MPRPRTGRSEASRQKDRDRVRRWRKANPERARAITRRAWKKYAPKIAERLARLRALELARTAHRLNDDHELSLVSEYELRRPNLYFIDARGRVWQEDRRSAEQLIRDYQRSQNPRDLTHHLTPTPTTNPKNPKKGSPHMPRKKAPKPREKGQLTESEATELLQAYYAHAADEQEEHWNARLKVQLYLIHPKHHGGTTGDLAELQAAKYSDDPATAAAAHEICARYITELYIAAREGRPLEQVEPPRRRAPAGDRQTPAPPDRRS